MERESGRRNRKGEEVSRVGSSKKNREANGEGRQRWPWVKGRVVSSGIRSRERITCYPTSPTGIWPPRPPLAREYCCRSALTLLQTFSRLPSTYTSTFLPRVLLFPMSLKQTLPAWTKTDQPTYGGERKESRSCYMSSGETSAYGGKDRATWSDFEREQMAFLWVSTSFVNFTSWPTVPSSWEFIIDEVASSRVPAMEVRFVAKRKACLAARFDQTAIPFKLDKLEAWFRTNH